MHVLLVWIVYATAVLYCTQISVAQPDGNGCNTEGAIRLVGGASELEGRIEMCTQNMTWTAVCGEARVICRMLGYSQIHATAYPEPRLQDQSLNISCEENAMTLDDCEWSSECINSQSGRVHCQPVCEDGDARLVRGQSDLEGLLEVCDGETWSRVYWCDHWNSSEASASVACRQMGHSRFGASASSEPSSNDTSSIRSLKCVGTESKLLDCSDNFDQGCGVSDMVKVHCQPYCALCNTTVSSPDPLLQHFGGGSGNETTVFAACIVIVTNTGWAMKNKSSFNCDAVGGTLGALVIVLVLLLAGVTAGLVYFIAKEFKCKGREEHQPAKPEEDLEEPDERTLHNPMYGCGSEAVGAHSRKTDAVIPSQYSCIGPENTGVNISQSGKVHYTK